MKRSHESTVETAETQWRTGFTSDVFRPYAGIYSWSRCTRKEGRFLWRRPRTHNTEATGKCSEAHHCKTPWEQGADTRRLMIDAVSARRLMPWKQETWVYSQVHDSHTEYSPPATTQAFLTHAVKPMPQSHDRQHAHSAKGHSY